MSIEEERIREIAREEIALWYTGGRTDSLYVVEEESAVNARNFQERWDEASAFSEDDGPVAMRIKAILRGEHPDEGVADTA